MNDPVEIAPGVHRMGSDVVNWYLVEEQGRLTAIDAGLSGFGDRLEGDLALIGRSLSDVEAVVLTHSDSDHTGLAPRLQAAGARVLVHRDDQASLRKPGPKGGDASIPRVLWGLRHRNVRRVVADMARNGGRPVGVEADATFEDGEALDVPGRPRAIHAPGHTHGHCALLIEDAGVLFVGDAMLTHEWFSQDRSPRLMPSMMNLDTAQALASWARLERVDAGLLLPGHGDPWRDGARAAATAVRAAAGA